MATIKYRELRRRYELEGADKTTAHLSEALREKHLAPDDFSIRCLAEALVTTRGGDAIGHDWVREYCDPRGGRLLLEAGDGVDTTAFSNITGQVIYSKILDAYQHPEFVLSQMVQAVPTRLSGEKIPGIGRMGDQAAQVDEGMPYESVGFGEEFIETPPTAKRGFIVPVTKEAVFFDRTNLILSRAAEVGEFLGLNKEKRIADVVVGAVNNYKRNGTASNTYLTSGAWINALASNELLDWTSIDNAEQLWADMTDPNTGEPILVSGKSLLVMPAKRHTTNRILNATEVSESTGSATLTASDNPVGGGQYTARASVIAYNRIQSELGESAADAKKWWFLGDFPKAFAYMENWPVTVTQAPQNSEADFNQDIVIRFKASERGAAAVLDPRFVIKSTG